MSDALRPWLESGAPDEVRASLRSATLDEPTSAQLGALQSKLAALLQPPGGPDGDGGDGGGGEGAPGDGGGALGDGGASGGVSGGAAAPQVPVAGGASALGQGVVGAGTSGAVVLSGAVKTALTAVLASAAVGAGSFVAGVQYEKAQVAQEARAPVALVAPQPTPEAQPEVEADVEPDVEPEPQPGVEAAAPAKPGARAPAAKAKQGPVAALPSDDEVRLLREAMEALRAGQPAEATRRLDAWSARFPNGALTQEAEVLAVEALLRQARRAEAEARVASFRKRWPASPHLLRLEALLKGP